MNVRDVMRRNVITIDPDASIMDSMRKMVNERITSLIVEKPTDKSVYGIITRKDIVNKVIAYNKDLKNTKVSEVMSEPILTISPDLSIETVARLMAKTDIRRFPVMEGNKLIGLISNSDILKAINKKLEGSK
ncbi:MAG TPA: CBS domain-containing protein [Candidatus Altiarchaeales archaeon]|nr:CBS domain-containing protein [Candidatus Altiarchaeales archaeon]